MLNALRPLLLAALLAASGLSFAAAPHQKAQVPGYYRLNVGAVEVTALYEIGRASCRERVLRLV